MQEKQKVIGIHNDFIYGESDFNKRYKKILDYNNIRYVNLDINDGDFWNKVKQIDYFIFRVPHYHSEKQIAKAIIPIIENEYKVKSFPSNRCLWPFDDKIRQYYLLKTHGYPMTQSYVFWNMLSALAWLEDTSFPLVFKLKSGAGSTNVVLIKDKEKGRKLIKKMFTNGVASNKVSFWDSTFVKDFSLSKFIKKRISRTYQKFFNEKFYEKLWQKEKGYVLFQKYLPNNEYDTRVTVIGGRAFAYRRFNRKKDFRASGSGRIDYDNNNINLRCVELALKISEDFDFISMAYDFLFNDKGEPEITEMCYTYVDKYVYNCSGYWDKNLNWHNGHYWPQYFQLVELLNEQELKMPYDL